MPVARSWFGNRALGADGRTGAPGLATSGTVWQTAWMGSKGTTFSSCGAIAVLVVSAALAASGFSAGCSGPEPRRDLGPEVVSDTPIAQGDTAGAGGTDQPPAAGSSPPFEPPADDTPPGTFLVPGTNIQLGQPSSGNYDLPQLEAGDSGPGFMKLANGIANGVPPESVPMEVRTVNDAGLPDWIEEAVYTRTESPGAVNLIWGINFREETGSGGRPWKTIDAREYSALEFYTKLQYPSDDTLSTQKSINLFIHDPTGNDRTEEVGTVNAATDWTRVVIDFGDPTNVVDLSQLGKVDLLVEVEDDNPPLEWWIAGMRLLE